MEEEERKIEKEIKWFMEKREKEGGRDRLKGKS